MQRRDQRLFIPVTPEEKAMIAHLVQESGLTIAAFVRQLIRDRYRELHGAFVSKKP